MAPQPLLGARGLSLDGHCVWPPPAVVAVAHWVIIHAQGRAPSVAAVCRAGESNIAVLAVVLVLAVSELGGGWGFICRLEEVD